MLQIILFILKIIGIVLIVLLGFILLTLTAVLLAPIRYGIIVEHGDDFFLEGKISWLLHFIHANITQENGKRHIKIRVLGFVVYDNFKIRHPKKAMKQHKKTFQKKAKRVKDKQLDKVIADEPKKSEVISDPSKTKAISRMNQMLEKDKKERNDYESTSTGGTDQLQYSDHTKERSKDSLWKRILFLIKKPFIKIFHFYVELKKKIIQIYKTIGNIDRMIGLIKGFLKDEINREGLKETLRSGLKLLKHVLPTKLESSVLFGTGDPCSTGQMLGVFGILYSFYGNNINIEPNFTEKVFKGKHKAKGRIRLMTLLIIVIKLIIDKRFKHLQRNIRILKEAL